MIVEHGSRSGSKLGSAAGGMGHGAADGQSAGHVQQQQQQQQYRHVYRRATVDAVAGAVAGAAARTVVSPLDVIKIRFQVQLEPTTRRGGPAGFSGVSKYTGIVQAARDIVREEGIVGLWRGNLPALMLVMPYTAIQFVVVQNFKAYVAGSSKGGWPLHQPAGNLSLQQRQDDIAKLGPAMSFAGGSLAGCAATIGSYPFDLLRTILASQGEPKVYPNLRSAFRSIFQTKGWTGLYAGLVPSLVEIIPYAGIQFGAYDILKRWTSAWNKERSGASESVELSSLEHFCCGLAAGTVAKVLCHPLDVVKKRFQVEGLARDLRYGARVREKAYRNMWDAMNRIVEKEGWVGLYKGTGPSVVKAAPAAAITFVVYEIASKRLEKILEEDT